MLSPGMCLGPYRITRFLAKGTSEVYLAEDPRIPREVAIKVMETEETQFANTAMLNDAVNAFQREAQMISRLGGHVYILALFDYGQVTINGTIYTYLVMPYQQEGTLTDWLRKRSVNGSTVLAPLDACKILNIAADSLQYAHDQGVVHRDVKPSNFLIGNMTTKLGDPSLLLADFGIARLQQNTDTTQPIGTPLYMAPEQWKGHPVPATDQYALAIIMFFLLTGKYPFEGDLPTLAIAHSKEKPPRPSEFNAQLSHNIDKVLLRALEKKPHNRYASVAEFAGAFEEAANKDIQNLPQNAIISHKPKARLPLIGIAVLLVLILFATTGGTLFYLQQRNTGFSRATATASTLQKTVVSQNNATRTAQINATSTAQVNATATAQVNATSTAQAIAAASSYPFAPPSSRVINEQFPSDYQTKHSPYGWQIQKEANFGCLLTSGGYTVTETGKSTSHVCFNENLSYNNFTYQANLHITQGDCAGIIFRSDPTNTNYYVFYICRDNSFSFYKVANNQVTLIYNGTSQNIRTGTGPNDVNVIAVAAQGNNLQFFVNSNQAIYSTPDNTYTSGGIGVIAVDKSKPTSVEFKVVEVFQR